jgi:pimeloyl-ACP methyl ester carboxylesterase
VSEKSSVYIKEQGEGFPVILIHGFCETHAIWDSLAEELASEFKVIVLDLPGFGKSELLPIPFTLEEVSERVVQRLHQLGIKQCVVIGHSLGGYVTLAMAEQYPSLLAGFGLFHSTAYADSDEKKQSRNKVIEFVENNGVRPFIQSFVPPLFHNQKAEYVHQVVELAVETPKQSLIAYTKAMRDRPDRVPTVRNFPGKILFIAGENDSGIPVDLVKKQAEQAKNAHFYRFKNVAHMGMFEDEKGTTRCIREFLQWVASD